MPQWHFLNFLAAQAKQFPAFKLRMESRVVDLLYDRGRIAGVRAKTPVGTWKCAPIWSLVVTVAIPSSAIEGSSRLRRSECHSMCFWMHISKRNGDPKQLFGFVRHKKGFGLN